jgi:hypothetical protein
MAYLRITIVKGHSYYYIVRSERTGAKVRSKVLEYLGRDPDPARLKKATVYWGVKNKPGKGRRR